MRRSLLVLAAIATATLHAAPPAGAGLVGKGIKGGLSVTGIRDDIGDLAAPDSRVAFAAGGYLTLGWGGALELQPELLYVPKGGISEIDITNSSGNVTGSGRVFFALDYLEIPILARVTFPTAAAVRPSVMVGPAFAIKLRSRLFTHGVNPRIEDDLTFIQDTDVGIAMGGALEFRGGWLLDARYTLGLTNVWGSGSVLDARNGALTVLVGRSL